MAVTEKVIVADVGSEELKQIRLQLNRLTDAVAFIIASSVGVGGDAWSDLVDNLVTDAEDFRLLIASRELPEAPEAPLTPTKDS